MEARCWWYSSISSFARSSERNGTRTQFAGTVGTAWTTLVGATPAAASSSSHDAPSKTHDALIEEWAACNAHEAHRKLSSPDVSVTNQSDKDVQLQKMAKLDDRCRERMLEANRAASLVAAKALAHARLVRRSRTDGQVATRKANGAGIFAFFAAAPASDIADKDVSC